MCREMRDCTGTFSLVAAFFAEVFWHVWLVPEFGVKNELLKRFEPAPLSNLQAMACFVPTLTYTEMRTMYVCFWKYEYANQSSRFLPLLCQEPCPASRLACGSSFLGQGILWWSLLTSARLVAKARRGCCVLGGLSLIVIGGLQSVEAKLCLCHFICLTVEWCKGFRAYVHLA